MPSIPIAILNWNGDADSIACLESIRAADTTGFLPVLIDNGSAPEALERLRGGARKVFPKVVELTRADLASGGAATAALAHLDGETLLLVENGENLGFAGGSNVGVRVAERLGCPWVMLLNNDTVVAPDAFQVLRSFLEREPGFVAVTPQIRHFEPGDRIQNCGGHLTWLGSRRYHLADREISALPPTPHSVITFSTGCALLYKYAVTGALTEDFFFGEEDYDFALRLQRRGLSMACVHGSVIRHKGGSTIRKAAARSGNVLLYYANRLTNCRNHYGPLRWQLTRAAAYAYLPLVLRKGGIDPRKAFGIIREIQKHLRENRGVSRAQFQAMIARR